MQNNERLLPISVQSFEILRTNNCIYVDKTAYVYRLVHDVAQFFLSRPRRFGKSLLLSTLKSYWEGKKELFAGLAIEKLEADNKDAWKQYPVLYFDLNGEDYSATPVETVLIDHLKTWEEIYGITDNSETLGGRFKNLLVKVSQKTGLRCVVLVDEYDKPLLDLVDKPEMQEHNKSVFKGFFSNLKSCNDYIQFVFITGVTKFHKVSIFSDMNQLKDISLNEDFSGICGITESELRESFAPEISAMAQKNKITEEECLAQLKQQYDGYRFHHNGVGVYNPFSLINALGDKEFGSYWFETGTPSFLVKKIRDMDFDLRKFTDHTIYANASLMKDYSADNPDPTPILYQSGYLTIVDYDPEDCEYTLAFPNNEVKYGFLQNLMPEYFTDCSSGSGIDIFTFRRYIKKGDLENIRKVLTALFARITYTSSNATFEHYFQTVIYLVFTLLGQSAECEMHTFSGRIDCRVQTKNFIYLFEFKRDESAEAALQQINDKDYTLPFIADSRKLYKIGVSFDSEKRILSDWKVEE